jgi:hypothetical protein
MHFLSVRSTSIQYYTGILFTASEANTTRTLFETMTSNEFMSKEPGQSSETGGTLDATTIMDTSTSTSHADEHDSEDWIELMGSDLLMKVSFYD